MPAEIADWLDADCVAMETDLSPVCDLMKATNKSWVTERGSGESGRDHVRVWFWSDRKTRFDWYSSSTQFGVFVAVWKHSPSADYTVKWGSGDVFLIPITSLEFHRGKDLQPVPIKWKHIVAMYSNVKKNKKCLHTALLYLHNCSASIVLALDGIIPLSETTD